MNKIKSLDELRQRKAEMLSTTEIRITGENENRTVIAVGMATCGIAAGARGIMTTILDEIAKNNVENVSVIAIGCPGMCHAEPLVEVRVHGKDFVKYGNVTEDIAKKIITDHIMQGKTTNNVIVGREVTRNE